MKTYKTWENLKTYFTETYFEIKGDNELNKKHIGFVADDTIYHSHKEEAHMADTLDNPEKAVT